MKKKVLAQINTLAKSIITSENDIDIVKAKNTLIHLYEKLTVLEFLRSSVETEFEKPERTATDSRTYREETWFQDPKPVPQPENSEALVEPLMEKIKDIVAQMPNDTEKIDDLLNDILPKKEMIKNDLEEFAKTYQETPVFERKQETVSEKNIATPKPKSINENLNQGLNIDLNDRIAFIKHLFEDNADDYTRVLSQINSMTTYNEASLFIEENVKSDYNNWENKEEYSARFMLIIEKLFN